MMTQIERIKSKLGVLRDTDKRFAIFGAQCHHYALNDTLSLEDILVIEKENDVRFSDDYKLLLMELGNGGAGCGFGFEKLNLSTILPPYIGTEKVKEKYDGSPEQISKILSGYIRLFDFGCATELILVVKGEEVGTLLWFDCDGAFKKVEKSLIDIYEEWVEESLEEIKTIQEKMLRLPIMEVIESEWKQQNFLIRGIIYSILDINTPKYGTDTQEYEEFMEKAVKKWKENKSKK